MGETRVRYAVGVMIDGRTAASTESLLAAVRAVLPHALIALDFDGTLAEISPRPRDARPLQGVPMLLGQIRRTGATVAVITGRTTSSLLEVSGLGSIPGIVIYGLHGAERWRHGRLEASPPPSGIAYLRDRLPGVIASAVQESAIWIEDKGLSLVIHARLTSEPDTVIAVLAEPIRRLANRAGLDVRPGKEVLEICLPGIDKGTAIDELLTDDTSAVLYAGDDIGDVPAFDRVREWAKRTRRPALAIAVTGPNTSVAQHSDVAVPNPLALLSLLRRFAGAPP
jgi:trehalose 6-phosphate phosphatase